MDLLGRLASGPPGDRAWRAATALVAGLAVAAAEPRLPQGEVRYRVEIAGAPVGFAQLSVSCSGPACALLWRSRLRLPAASGGALRTRRVKARVDRAGRLGSLEVDVDGVRRSPPRRPGSVPLSAAELVLSARGGGCIEVLDEETGRSGPACARLEGGGMRMEILGTLEEVTPGEDGFPEAVDIEAQRTRFVRDGRADVPATAPPLEVRVPGPAGGGTPRRFCGRPPDPPAPTVDVSSLPEPRPDGSSCRDQAQAYAALLRRRGIPARLALGVADDGSGFVWHAWVEARTDTGWVAVDPAFGQLPARGARFTVARHRGDAAGAAEAGRRILACWGTGAVE
jgi:hypothetical protein